MSFLTDLERCEDSGTGTRERDIGQGSTEAIGDIDLPDGFFCGSESLFRSAKEGFH
jgi:hypothetical protein